MTRTHPRLAASAAALGWFVGLYALPFAHNFDHRDDHTHRPAAEAPHHHPHEPREEAHPHEAEAPEDRVPLDSDHGSGSILHFAAAAVEGQTFELPERGPRIPLPSPPSRPHAPASPVQVVLVRGPPVLDPPPTSE